MHLDILIFAIIAFVLIMRLKSVLGVKDDDVPSMTQSFILDKKQEQALKEAIEKAIPEAIIVEDVNTLRNITNKDLIDEGNAEEIEEGLNEIAEVDKDFDIEEFIEGSKAAFDIIVNAYRLGNCDELKPLLSQKLYNDFEHAIQNKDEQETLEGVKQINSAKIVEAHLKGTMSYIVVEYNVVTDNEEESKDIWTFTRDTRSDDPNWILIETKAS